MIRIAVGAVLAVAALLFPAYAHDTFTLGSLEISGAFGRATLPNAPVGGGYLTITNAGTEDDVLIAATSPVASDVTLHSMTLEGDVMKMAELPGGIAVPAGETVILAPGGLHIMLMGLKAPLVEGEAVPLTLVFAKAGAIEITLVVGSMAADEPEHPGEHK